MRMRFRKENNNVQNTQEQVACLLVQTINEGEVA
jgi:hypothetical protein